MYNIKFEDTNMMISSLGDFFQNIGESDCDCGAFNGRIDPLLKLYNNCELMLTTNEDVSHGKANGTLLNFVKVILKRNSSISTTIIKGKKVKIVGASQVKYIIVKNKDKDPKIFHIEPIEKKFVAKYPLPIEVRKKLSIASTNLKLKVKGNQIPLISNDACTGWKLQGATVDNIYAIEWFPACKNWVYVIL